MPLIFVGIALLVAAAAAADDYDQRRKRQQEQQRFRRELEMMAERLADREREQAALQALLGTKNQQVRVLATEVERLRAELARMRHRASV